MKGWIICGRQCKFKRYFPGATFEPVRSVRAEVPIGCDEVAHLPLYKYLLSPLQGKTLSRHVPELHIMKSENRLH